MQNETLQVQIITSNKKLLTTDASEVVIPAFDGEMGILPQHEHFIGTLGTGPLKVVRDGKDYWYAISEGVFEVTHSKLTVLAHDGIEADQVDSDLVRSELQTLESIVGQMDSYDPEFGPKKLRVEYLKSLLEAYRRHALVH